MQNIKYLISILSVLLLNIFDAVMAQGTNGTSELVLHLKDENRSVTLRGDLCSGGAVFENLDVSCVCVSGLWVLYQRECEFAYVILAATNGQCFRLNTRVRKASLISPIEESSYSSSAAVFDENISSIGGKFFTEKGIPSTTYFVPSGFPVVITTGKQTWRIPHRKICMRPNSLDPNVTNYYYCHFKHYTYEEYRLLDEECSKQDEILSPIECTPYVSKDDANENHCIEVEVTARKPPSVYEKRGHRVRRSDEIISRDDGNGTSVPNDAPVLDNDDENHGLVVAIARPIINSEIWNFMTYRAQLRLGIREVKVADKSSLAYSPAFEFLEIAKQIQQKACPEHYVSNEHYDISVGAFVSLQKNYLRYLDPYLDYSTSERIIDALTACLNNITTYPFLERIGKEGVSCNGSTPIKHGSYVRFDQILELSLSPNQSSRANEPIIETVWKIFVHANSACFPYFKESFNDHHRFATVMLPLFTNEVNEMWFSVTELKPDIYSRFLGDAVDLMDSVAYCAMFSRLDSTYPWDLPRPKKDNARKKRQVSEGYSGFECLEDYDARNVCPNPVDR